MSEELARELDDAAKLRREWRDEAVSDYGKAEWEDIAVTFDKRAEVLRSLLTDKEEAT